MGSIFRRKNRQGETSGPWYAKVSGVRKSLGTEDRKEALKRLSVLEAEAWKGNLLGIAKKPQEHTLEEVYTRALKTHFRDQKDVEGVEARWATLTRFLPGSTKLSALTRLRCEDVVLDMREATWSRGENGTPRPYTDATINRVLSLLGKLTTLAEDWEWLDRAPKMPKTAESGTFKRRPITEAEYKRMLEALWRHPNPRWAAYCDLLRVLWGTGCRLSEVTQLEWSQVDLDRKVLTWADTKGGNAVGKPMTDDVCEVLRTRKVALMPRPFGDFTEQTMRDAWDWACKEAGIQDRERVVRHSLRHSAVTRVLVAGHSLAVAGKLAGHKSLRTTQLYEHLSVEHLRSAAGALEGRPAVPIVSTTAPQKVVPAVSFSYGFPLWTATTSVASTLTVNPQVPGSSPGRGAKHTEENQ